MFEQLILLNYLQFRYQLLTLNLQDLERSVELKELKYYTETSLDKVYNYAETSLDMIRQSNIRVFSNQDVMTR